MCAICANPSGLRLALILSLLAISLLLERAKARISHALATRSVTQNQILLRRCMNRIGSMAATTRMGLSIAREQSAAHRDFDRTRLCRQRCAKNHYGKVDLLSSVKPISDGLLVAFRPNEAIKRGYPKHPDKAGRHVLFWNVQYGFFRHRRRTDISDAIFA